MSRLLVDQESSSRLAAQRRDAVVGVVAAETFLHMPYALPPPHVLLNSVHFPVA